MAFRITNRAKHLLIIPLNSGKTVYLAPDESSSSIEDLEITGNEKVEKLVNTNLIATTKVVPVKEPKAEPERMPEEAPAEQPEVETEKEREEELAKEPEAEPEEKEALSEQPEVETKEEEKVELAKEPGVKPEEKPKRRAKKK